MTVGRSLRSLPAPTQPPTRSPPGAPRRQLVEPVVTRRRRHQHVATVATDVDALSDLAHRAGTGRWHRSTGTGRPRAARRSGWPASPVTPCHLASFQADGHAVVAVTEAHTPRGFRATIAL